MVEFDVQGWAVHVSCLYAAATVHSGPIGDGNIPAVLYIIHSIIQYIQYRLHVILPIVNPQKFIFNAIVGCLSWPSAPFPFVRSPATLAATPP